MGKEINLSKDTALSGSEYVRGIDDLGRSVNIPIEVLQAFIQTNQRFAIYDGAAGAVAYSEQISDTAITTAVVPVRLEFGDLTDEDYWPGDYAGLMNNQESAPAASVFDFRTLPLGTFVEFDIEFDTEFEDALGQRIDYGVLVYFDFTYPNGNVERQTFQLANDYLVGISEVPNSRKLTFSTYIKDALTDKLMGGSISWGVIDDLSSTQFLTISNLIVRAKL